MSDAVTTPLPVGFGVELDPSTRELREGIWFGGSPARVMRLTRSGAAAWADLRGGTVETRTAGLLARKLTDAGLAHPCPPPATAAAEITVIIPVRDRSAGLDRCLTALGSEHRVVVVDDESADATAVAEVVAGHGATLVRRDHNGGPGVARNTGLEQVDTEFVAFVDSDCLPKPGWLDKLIGHFADPLLAAVAPRVTPLSPRTAAGRYTASQSSLDMGGAPSRVAPGTRVSYVPSAALLVRRAALLDVARDGAVFDPRLRVGEDVDLVWRLNDAGWRVRYVPDVSVAHQEPTTWIGLYARRLRYGTSAASLAQRHGRAMAPMVVHPWPALTAGALLGRRPLVAAAAFAASVLTMRRTLRRNDIPTAGVVKAMATGAQQTFLGAGRYCVQFAAPLVVLVAARGGRRRLIAAAALLLAPPVSAWSRDRRALDPARFVLAWLFDQMSYGAGVWAGCATQGTTVPLRPIVDWTQLRIQRPANNPRGD